MDLRLCWYSELGIGVTGATGYIGKSISACANQKPQLLPAISDLPREAILIHLACNISGPQVLTTNFELDRFVIQEAAGRVKGLIYASGNNVYNLGLKKAVSDFGPTLDEYGTSKRVGEALVQSLFPRSWAILRIADVFGAGQRHGNLFRSIENAIKARTPLKLYGIGGKIRSYVHTPDLIACLLHFARSLRAQDGTQIISNVCYAESPSVRDILTMIAERAALDIEHVALDDDRSASDIRSMVPGPFLGFDIGTFDRAISDYIVACTSARPQELP